MNSACQFVGLQHFCYDDTAIGRPITHALGYVEALADNVDYIQTDTKRCTATGIEMVDGKHREVDAIFCPTGANTSVIPEL